MKAHGLLAHQRTIRKFLPSANRISSVLFSATFVLTLGLGTTGVPNALAQATGSPLTITNESAPPDYDGTYTRQSRQNTSRDQNWPQQRSRASSQGQADFRESGQFAPPEATHVSKKVRNLRAEYREIANMVKDTRGRFDKLENQTRTRSNEYFADVAALNTELQTGTTPGNPRHTRRLNAARSNLDSLSQVLADMNALSMDVGDISSRASALMENIRAAYNISGAVEADHAALTRLEDDVQDILITIDRLQKKVSDSMTRMRAYLSSETDNLRTLSLAVANGNYYGRSLSYRPFSNVPQTSSAAMSARQQQGGYAQNAKRRNASLLSQGQKRQDNQRGARPQQQTAPASSKRPVMKIRFTRPNVKYEQALYTAISDAQKKYPDASFELVAVYPDNGNDARSAIESTRARRNAEDVLRKMREMGLPARNIQLSRQTSKSANNSEVHIYLHNG